MKSTTAGLLVGAVIGTLIFPGVGTIIGGYIGYDVKKPDKVVIIKESGDKDKVSHDKE